MDPDTPALQKEASYYRASQAEHTGDGADSSLWPLDKTITILA